MLFFPLFSRGFAGNFIKLSVGSVLILYPAYASMEYYRSQVITPTSGVFTFLSEVMLGSLLGLITAIPWFAFKAVGAMVDVYRGATFAAQTTGSDSGEELPLETLFGLVFAALIFAGPGLPVISHHLLNSYLLLPPGTLSLDNLYVWTGPLLRMLADHITFAVLLSAPILIAVLIVELIMEIISAFAQQLQVYSLQFGLRSVLGIAFLLLVLEFASEEILNMFFDYSNALNELLGSLK